MLLVDFISNAGKHYDATFYSCLPVERQEFVQHSIKTALKFKRKCFKCQNIEGNITHCAFQENKNAVIFVIKDATDTIIVQSLAVLLDK